jgi:ubiquinone/menaquinone biosynthesis C-methylase UbiE
MNTKQNKIIDYEYVSCVLCGSDKYKEEACGKDYRYGCSDDYFHIVKCNICGHLYLNPRPKVVSADIIYPRHYSTFSRHYVKAKFGIAKIKSTVILNRLNFFKSMLEASSRILDIGCGDGQLLMDLHKKYPNLELWGLDMSFEKATYKTLQENNVNLIVGRLEEVQLPDNYFDLAVMNQLIEHLWQPKEALIKIFRALKPKGFVSIETVNPCGYDRNLFKKNFWGGYYMPRHLNLFSRQHLKKFLENIGFKVERYADLCAPVVWAFSLQAWIKGTANGFSWLSRFFSDINPVILAVFSVIDTIAKLLGKNTSNQKIILSKP